MSKTVASKAKPSDKIRLNKTDNRHTRILRLIPPIKKSLNKNYSLGDKGSSDDDNNEDKQEQTNTNFVENTSSSESEGDSVDINEVKSFYPKIHRASTNDIKGSPKETSDKIHLNKTDKMHTRILRLIPPVKKSLNKHCTLSDNGSSDGETALKKPIKKFINSRSSKRQYKYPRESDDELSTGTIIVMSSSGGEDEKPKRNIKCLMKKVTILEEEEQPNDKNEDKQEETNAGTNAIKGSPKETSDKIRLNKTDKMQSRIFRLIPPKKKSLNKNYALSDNGSSGEKTAVKKPIKKCKNTRSSKRQYKYQCEGDDELSETILLMSSSEGEDEKPKRNIKCSMKKVTILEEEEQPNDKNEDKQEETNTNFVENTSSSESGDGSMDIKEVKSFYPKILKASTNAIKVSPKETSNKIHLNKTDKMHTRILRLIPPKKKSLNKNYALSDNGSSGEKTAVKKPIKKCKNTRSSKRQYKYQCEGDDELSETILLMSSSEGEDEKPKRNIKCSMKKVTILEEEEQPNDKNEDKQEETNTNFVENTSSSESGDGSMDIKEVKSFYPKILKASTNAIKVSPKETSDKIHLNKTDKMHTRILRLIPPKKKSLNKNYALSDNGSSGEKTAVKKPIKKCKNTRSSKRQYKYQCEGDDELSETILLMSSSEGEDEKPKRNIKCSMKKVTILEEEEQPNDKNEDKQEETNTNFVENTSSSESGDGSMDIKEVKSFYPKILRASTNAIKVSPKETSDKIHLNKTDKMHTRILRLIPPKKKSLNKNYALSDNGSSGEKTAVKKPIKKCKDTRSSKRQYKYQCEGDDELSGTILLMSSSEGEDEKPKRNIKCSMKKVTILEEEEQTDDKNEDKQEETNTHFMENKPLSESGDGSLDIKKVKSFYPKIHKASTNVRTGSPKENSSEDEDDDCFDARSVSSTETDSIVTALVYDYLLKKDISLANAFKKRCNPTTLPRRSATLRHIVRKCPDIRIRLRQSADSSVDSNKKYEQYKKNVQNTAISDESEKTLSVADVTSKQKTTEENFWCQICPKTFKSEGNFNRHLNMHQSGRRFKCHHTNCYAEFAWQSQLKTHALIHAGEKSSV